MKKATSKLVLNKTRIPEVCKGARLYQIIGEDSTGGIGVLNEDDEQYLVLLHYDSSDFIIGQNVYVEAGDITPFVGTIQLSQGV